MTVPSAADTRDRATKAVAAGREVDSLAWLAISGGEPTSRHLESPRRSPTRRSRSITRPSHHATATAISAVTPRFVHKSVHNFPPTSHHDDVAAAIALAATTSASPGAYNIAGDGDISLSDVARNFGARPLRVPAVTAKVASAALTRLPFLPSAFEPLHLFRTSTVMDTGKAKSDLGWTPKFTAEETLRALTDAT